MLLEWLAQISVFACCCGVVGTCEQKRRQRRLWAVPARSKCLQALARACVHSRECSCKHYHLRKCESARTRARVHAQALRERKQA